MEATVKLESHLEIEFAQLWEEYYPEIDLYHNDLFAKPVGRKFEADFCHREARVIIEIQGATRSPGKGHSSGAGIQRDCEKFCLAASLGYLVFPLTGEMIDLTWLRLIAQTIESRCRS